MKLYPNKQKFLFSLVQLGFFVGFFLVGLGASVLTAPTLALTTQSPSFILFFTSLVMAPSIYVYARYLSSFLSDFWEKLSRPQKSSIALYLVIIEPYLYNTLSHSYLLLSLLLAIIGMIIPAYILFSHFHSRTLHSSQAVTVLFFLHLFINLGWPFIHFFKEYQWLIFDDDYPGISKKEIDHKEFSSKNSQDLIMFDQILLLIPNEFQKLHFKVKVIPEDFPFLSPSTYGFVPKSLSKSSIIFINKALLKAGNLTIIRDTLIHEMAHVYQKEKYQLSHFFHPRWKDEGHAVWVQNQYRSDDHRKYFYNRVTDFFVNTKRYPSFSYLDKDFNYSAAFAQAWYYLEYQNMTEEMFFSSDIELAPWVDIKAAWYNNSSESIERHLQEKQDSCIEACIMAQEMNKSLTEASHARCHQSCALRFPLTY